MRYSIENDKFDEEAMALLETKLNREIDRLCFLSETFGDYAIMITEDFSGKPCKIKHFKFKNKSGKYEYAPIYKIVTGAMYRQYNYKSEYRYSIETHPNSIVFRGEVVSNKRPVCDGIISIGLFQTSNLREFVHRFKNMARPQDR